MSEIVYTLHYRHIDKEELLGPADFDGYEHNRPGPKWQLVRCVEPAPTCRSANVRAWSSNVFSTRAAAEKALAGVGTKG